MRATGKLADPVAQRIRRLAEIHTDEPVVASVYVDLDPTEFPTPKQRSAEIESLLDDVRSKINGDLSHDARNELHNDIQRIGDWLQESANNKGARAFAVFACSRLDLLDTFKLSASVDRIAAVATSPLLEPLVANLPGESWCVFLVNRKNARILRGSRERLFEIEEVSDDVHGQHDQGGWSQARYQRSVEEDVKDHVQHATDRLFDDYGRIPFDRLLVACPEELWPEVEGKLHSYLLDRFVGRVEADVEHSNPDDVLERARPTIDAAESRQEAELIERLAQNLGRHERAASGLGPVLEALNEQRVDVLLLDRSLDTSGVVCRRCGWLGRQGSECPVDREPLQVTGDVVEAAVTRAVLQSAAVHEIRYHEPQRALGDSIAALLRY